MSIKILQLSLVLVLTFVEFSLSTAQLLKLRVQTKFSLKLYFDSNLLLRLKRQEQNFLI